MNKKNKNISTKKYILASQREKRNILVVLVITWSLYSSLSRLWDVLVVVFWTAAMIRPHNANNILCFEQIDVAFVQTNDIYILAATFTYY